MGPSRGPSRYLRYSATHVTNLPSSSGVKVCWTELSAGMNLFNQLVR
jgi:hypothetical protein